MSDPIDLLRAALDAAPEGVVICEARPPDYPLVYANAAFTQLTGYAADELAGQDLRRLQSWDRDQEERARLREALSAGQSCRVLLRNYRKDGTQFWNELLVRPLADADGVPSHFVGFHHDVSERERSTLRHPSAVGRWQEDRLSGLGSQAFFEERLRHEWQAGLGERNLLSLLAFDVDEFAAYNDTFGRAAGDACIRRVAGVIAACFRRGSDVVARWQGDCILAMVRNADPAALSAFTAGVSQRILELRIHHPRAHHGRFISVSVGSASVAPCGGLAPRVLVDRALQSLAQAQQTRQAVASTGAQGLAV